MHARVAGHKGEYPLAKPLVMRRLIDTIEHFSRIYFCEVAAFSIPGSHYHLVVVKFEEERPVSREELREKTRLLSKERPLKDRAMGIRWPEKRIENRVFGRAGPQVILFSASSSSETRSEREYLARRQSLLSGRPRVRIQGQAQRRGQNQGQSQWQVHSPDRQARSSFRSREREPEPVAGADAAAGCNAQEAKLTRESPTRSGRHIPQPHRFQIPGRRPAQVFRSKNHVPTGSGIGSGSVAPATVSVPASAPVPAPGPAPAPVPASVLRSCSVPGAVNLCSRQPPRGIS